MGWLLVPNGGLQLYRGCVRDLYVLCSPALLLGTLEEVLAQASSKGGIIWCSTEGSNFWFNWKRCRLAVQWSLSFIWWFSKNQSNALISNSSPIWWSHPTQLIENIVMGPMNVFNQVCPYSLLGQADVSIGHCVCFLKCFFFLLSKSRRLLELKTCLSFWLMLLPMIAYRDSIVQREKKPDEACPKDDCQFLLKH